jgi:hypothetical protein
MSDTVTCDHEAIGKSLAQDYTRARSEYNIAVLTRDGEYAAAADQISNELRERLDANIISHRQTCHMSQVCVRWEANGNRMCDPEVLCVGCATRMDFEYPQGWSHYPGDICKHGKYTGGSGIDWMCGPCEMGE